MNKYLIKCLFMLMFSAFIKVSTAQKTTTPAKVVFTADSLTSGNTKDIVTNFFQLGLNNLIGSNREFNFSSSPFALMLKENPKLKIDSKYKMYKPLRRLNVSFGVKLDSSFNFNGLSAGLKYSIIDRRDYTASKFIAASLRKDPLKAEKDVLLNGLYDYADSVYADSSVASQIQFNNKTNEIYSKDIPLNKYDAIFQAVVKKIVLNNNLKGIQNAIDSAKSFFDLNKKKVDSLKNSIKNKLLWTIGISDTTYKDKFQSANVVIVSELSKGILPQEKGSNNIEINAKAAYNFLNDTLQKERNLKRQLLTLEGGLNWVIRDKTTDKSFFELKLSFSYYHNYAALYDKEDRDKYTFNFTPRIRIYEDIWLPLEIKYDPASGNILGLFNIKANFSGLGKMLNGSNK